MNAHRPRKIDLSVYLVTDTRLCGMRGVVQTVRTAVAGGVTLVQLREPHAPARKLIAEARELLAILRPARIPLIVNDRLDVAMVAGADGIHVGQTDITPADIRRLAGPDFIIGMSVGSLDELAASPLDEVDYLGVGPVYATGTKHDAGAAIGVAGMAAIRAHVTHGIVGIGGISAENAAPVIHAGANGVAVVSAICAAADPQAAASRIAAAVRGAHERAAGEP